MENEQLYGAVDHQHTEYELHTVLAEEKGDRIVRHRVRSGLRKNCHVIYHKNLSLQKWTVAIATVHIIDDRNRSLNYFFCTYFLISREIATKITIPIAMY